MTELVASDETAKAAKAPAKADGGKPERARGSGGRPPAAPPVRISVTNRVVAKVIDLLIFFLLAALLPRFVGPLVGFVYSLCADGMNFGGFQGQSVGKKLLGLQVVNRVSGGPASFKDSVRRNAPVGVATFFAIIPIWGWIILVLVGVPLMAIEIYLMVRVENGHRLGDVIADTEVVESDRPKSRGESHGAQQTSQ